MPSYFLPHRSANVTDFRQSSIALANFVHAILAAQFLFLLHTVLRPSRPVAQSTGAMLPSRVFTISLTVMSSGFLESTYPPDGPLTLLTRSSRLSLFNNCSK